MGDVGVHVEQNVYRPRGAAWDFFYTYTGPDGDPGEGYKEVLFEGVAGGGKSLAFAHAVHNSCIKYPGCQVLMVRKYRDSMTESCMKTYEEEVLKKHMPSICEGRDRSQRSFYEYPPAYNPLTGTVAQSRVVTCGITDEEKIRSTAWNIVWLNEGTEISVEHYETLLSRLRPQGDQVAPFNVIWIDCNPSYRGHWLNLRFMPDPKYPLKRLRLITNHKDNPTYWDDQKQDWTTAGREYMAVLSHNTGARYLRLYKGEWSTEEGQVYSEFDRSYHVIRRKDLPPIDYYFASVDWGYRNAGVIQVWGVDARQAMYLVHETYRAQETVDFWADEAVKLYAEFALVAFVCDPAAPDKRAQFNDRLSRYKAGRVSRLAIEANNDREAGMQEVKSGLLREKHAFTCKPDCIREDRHGPARIYFVEDSLRHGVCPILSTTRGHSICTTDEIQNLVWLKSQDGRPIKEMWDDSISHDGCDAMRYAAMFNWKRTAPRKKKHNPWPEGTIAHRLYREGIKIAQMN